MNIKQKIIRLYWLISTQFGFDIKVLLQSLRGLPHYFIDLLHFRLMYKGKVELVPCLHDWYEEGGAIKNEYFWQDLLVARMIFKENPEKHVDIGSRVDGFVAHVASFREIEVFDVRSISTVVPGVVFKQADFIEPLQEMTGYCDSISCLHALEHFGLGRYGDKLNASAFEDGLRNMSQLLQVEGKLYLSIPVGVERVEFNANRVFDPHLIIDMALKCSLKLFSMSVMCLDSGFNIIEVNDDILKSLASERYTLALFLFVKV